MIFNTAISRNIRYRMPVCFMNKENGSCLPYVAGCRIPVKIDKMLNSFDEMLE